MCSMCIYGSKKMPSWFKKKCLCGSEKIAYMVQKMN